RGRGRMAGQGPRGRTQVISGTVPLAEMFGYATDLRSRTQGRATFTMQFSHYEPVPKGIGPEGTRPTGGRLAEASQAGPKGAGGKMPPGKRKFNAKKHTTNTETTRHNNHPTTPPTP